MLLVAAREAARHGMRTYTFGVEEDGRRAIT